MPCNASYVKLFLEGFSYARQIDMQLICTFMLAKIYSCKKWVLHTEIGCPHDVMAVRAYRLAQEFKPERRPSDVEIVVVEASVG
jgi:hypothetical protein